MTYYARITVKPGTAMTLTDASTCTIDGYYVPVPVTGGPMSSRVIAAIDELGWEPVDYSNVDLWRFGPGWIEIPVDFA